ncbi:ABC transporter permease [Thermophilibacter provencensis]|uniref:FtsX-like permease family protein n=1 Tax=Thermophilibacter provencensis TaxID=1852386 RepID=A0ABT7V391_9ACTN|nr:FtsX-like permease family protein [Thermophilibacter provencensis]MDM8270486.1 FtsX-like permease family protein [Thermophilibacter provencensis]
MSAFATGIVRSVRSSLGRFLAIMVIVALGCGFFAGLSMSGPDMRAAADAYYDNTGLWDLRVISTLGFGEKDVGRLASVDGVDAAAGVMSVDAMVRVDTEQVAARVASLPDEYLSGEEPSLDQLILREGRYPSAAGECVVSADAPGLGLKPGDTIEVLYESGENDALSVHELTVVGTVSSSNYPYTISFGSTTLGSGMLDQYLYVSEDTFVEGTPFSEIHLSVATAEDALSGSDEYWDVVDEVRGRIEADAEGLSEARLDDLRLEAQDELDESRAEYERERADAEEELETSRDQLDEAASQISAAEEEVAAAGAELESGRSELASRRQQAEDELAAALAAIDSSQSELDARRSELEAQASQVEQARSSCESGVSVLLVALSEQGIEAGNLDAAVQALDAAISEQRAAKEQLVSAVEQLAALETAGALTDEQATQLESARFQLVCLDTTLPRLSSAREQASQLVSARDAVSAYDEGVTQVKAAQAQIDAARQELAEQRSSAESQLDEAQAQLDAAEAELEQGRSQLSSSRSEYEEGLDAWEDAREEADERFAEAEAELNDAQSEINSLEAPSLYVLDRSQSEGAATYQADSERMDTISTVFPFMLFLVAALVALTTMTRMVEDERVQMGTYKALGYSAGRIAGRYLAYAALASITGAVLGIAVLSQVLPYVVMYAYAIIYAVPQLPLPLTVDPLIALTSGGLGVGVTLFATLAAVGSALRETPAQLMQPRAPKAGRRILLERVRPLWSRLSFLRKVAARNLFRYKKRLLMTVIGVSGCTALLLVGFGLHDAIWDIIDNQFGPIMHYNTTVTLADDAGEKDGELVEGLLDDAGVDLLSRASLLNLRAGSDFSGETLSIQVVVPEDATEFGRALSLRERVSQKPLSLEGDGILLSEKAAGKLGVGVGDELVLYAQDAIGNATGDGVALRVDGVVENYVGNVAYLSPACWDVLARAGVFDDDAPSFSTLYLNVSEDAGLRDELAEELEATGAVSTVVFTDETVEMYRDMLSAVDLIVVVLIVSAAALAAVVLYNLTNINIGERVREIASLKVLGFKRGEVYAYIFREVLILTLLGDVVGLVLGTWLEGFVIVTAEVDVVMFGRVIHPASYVYAFVLTLVFSVLVMLMMRRKLDRIDMVESLKSVD